MFRARRLKLRPTGSARARHFAARGEEAILRDLLAGSGPITRCYVDIGASDGLKLSNTASLAVDGWPGVCFEWDTRKVAAMAAAYRDLPDVRICRTRIMPPNVCAFLTAFDVPSDFGVLSLDIDSYDYFVLDALLEHYRPSVIISEINEKIPPPLDFTVLFDERHGWDGSHFYGQSICRLATLCAARGYVIAHLEYNNAFLVDARRHPRAGLTAREAYDRGYRLREDRQREFPWNRDMEELLALAPADAIAFVKRRFAAYEGRYVLGMGDEALTPGGPARS